MVWSIIGGGTTEGAILRVRGRRVNEGYTHGSSKKQIPCFQANPDGFLTVCIKLKPYRLPGVEYLRHLLPAFLAFRDFRLRVKWSVLNRLVRTRVRIVGTLSRRNPKERKTGSYGLHISGLSNKSRLKGTWK